MSEDLIEEGHLNTIIDRCYALDQTAEAFSYVEGGHKRGNVVITIANSSPMLLGHED